MANKKKSAKKPSKTFAQKYPAKKSITFDEMLNEAGPRIARNIEQRKKAAFDAKRAKRLAREADMLRGVESIAFGGNTQKQVFTISVGITTRAQFKMICDRKGWKMSQVVNKFMEHIVEMHWHEIQAEHGGLTEADLREIGFGKSDDVE